MDVYVQNKNLRAYIIAPDITAIIARPYTRTQKLSYIIKLIANLLEHCVKGFHPCDHLRQLMTNKHEQRKSTSASTYMHTLTDNYIT